MIGFMARGRSPRERAAFRIATARNLRSQHAALPKDLDVSNHPGKSRNHKFVGKLLQEAGLGEDRILWDMYLESEDGAAVYRKSDKADSEQMALSALATWVPELLEEIDGKSAHPELARWETDMHMIMVQDGNHKASHRYGLGETAGDNGDEHRYWYPSVAQAARGFYRLPSDENGGLIAAGLIDGIRRCAYPPERTFTELMQVSPVRTLAMSCDAPCPDVEPMNLAKSLPGEAKALAADLPGAPTERRIAIDAAIRLAEAEGLSAKDTEAVVLAAAWSAPFGAGGGRNRAGIEGVSADAQERALRYLEEVGPRGDVEHQHLPVCDPSSPAGRVLADSLAAWMGHPQMDSVVDEQRIAMGLDDKAYGLALMDRSRELCTRTKFHTKTGRAEYAKRAKREGLRMCDLMNFVDCGERKNNSTTRQLRTA